MNSPFKNIYLLFFIVQCFSNFIKYQLLIYICFILLPRVGWDPVLSSSEQTNTTITRIRTFKRQVLFYRVIHTEWDFRDDLCGIYTICFFNVFFATNKLLYFIGQSWNMSFRSSFQSHSFWGSPECKIFLSVWLSSLYPLNVNTIKATSCPICLS